MFLYPFIFTCDLNFYSVSAQILKRYVRLVIFFSVSGHENPRLPFNVKPMADRTCHDVVVDVVIYTCDHDPRRERRLCIFACQYPMDMTSSSPPMARCCVRIMVMT